MIKQQKINNYLRVRYCKLVLFTKYTVPFVLNFDKDMIE